jgi:hypothetical protein
MSQFPTGIAPEIHVAARPHAQESSTNRQLLSRKSALIVGSVTLVVVIFALLFVPIRTSEANLHALVESVLQFWRDTKIGPAHRIEQTLNKIPATAVLRRIDPSGLDTIRKELTTKYGGGATEDDILSGARNLFFKVLQPYLVRAPDNAVLENIDIILSYMSGLSKVDTESCVSLVDESKGAKLQSNLKQRFPENFVREMALHAEILSAPVQTKFVVPPVMQQAKSQLAEVFNIIGSREGNSLGLLARDSLKVVEFENYCKVIMDLFREIRKLPRTESIGVFRYLYSLGGR